MAEKADGSTTAGGAEAQATENSAPVPEMRAITLAGYGGLKMLKVTTVPECKPQEGEVLIRVKTSGLNFLDLMVRQGAIDNPPKTPFTLGFECAGEVEALGENTSMFEIGDRVVAFSDYKAWGEKVAVPSQFVYKIPTGMSFQDGAAFLINYVTAYILIFDIGNVRSGHSILVHSVGGGVGMAICQLCKSIGDVTIFGTASYNKHEDLKNDVNHLFDHVVDYCQEIRKVSPEGVDVVMDCLCGEDTNKGIGILKPLGKYILFGTANVVTGETKSFFSFAKSWWQVDKINPLKLYDENKTVSGFNLRQMLFKQNKHEYVRCIINKLFTWYNEGKLRPHIDSAWAFEDVAEAMQKLHDRKNVGKVLLDPSLEPKPKVATDSQRESSDGDKDSTKKEKSTD